MGHKVRDAMTSDPKSVEPDGSVRKAAQVMKDADTGIVPVVEDGRLVGTITDRDIAIRVVAEGKDAESSTVAQVASRELVTVDPEQELDEALRLMAKHQVRRLPVVVEDGRVVGILSQADVARDGADAETGQLVQEISQ